MKPIHLLPLLALLACRPPQTAFREEAVQAAALVAAGDPARLSPDFLAGFRDGSAMVGNALREHRVPFLPQSGRAAPAPLPVGGLPEGVAVLTAPPEVELDADTGFPIHATYREAGGDFARGQEAGFRWALDRRRADLVRVGLLVARPRPGAPARWQPWQTGAGRLVLTRDGLAVGVHAGNGLVAWEWHAKGFPPRRIWRPAPEPRRLGLAEDALWVEYPGGQVAALDLATGLIRDVRKDVQSLGQIPESRETEWRRQEEAFRREDDALLAELQPQVEQGDAGALVRSARILSKRAPEEKREAFQRFRRAADQGSREALFELGLCHYHGLGTPVDREEARRWLKAAADRGDETAAYVLAELFPR